MTEREKLEQAIFVLENQRNNLGDAVVDAALLPMYDKLESLLEIQKIGKQRKLASVLFMDIVNSTSIIKKLDPEDAMLILDTALKRFQKPITAMGGRVTRFMGDGFLALFGAPIARENEAVMAVRAGLQILAEAKAYAREVEARWQISGFNVRIGINTGFIFIGGETEAENTLMGTTVNLAARLERNAKPGTLLISRHTFKHTCSFIEAQMLEPITAKGFEEPICVFQVDGVKPHIFRMFTQSVAGIETNMVCREPELLMLQNLFRDTVEDTAVNVVTIVGDAGVGKSRLVVEFEKWVDSQTIKVHFFKGYATSEAVAMPYGLVRSIFTQRFQILESDSAAEVRKKFRAGMAVALNSDQADLVGQLLGFDFSASPAVQSMLNNELFGKCAIDYLAEYFQVIAQNPEVMILEDAQWADDSSLDLLDYLVTVIPETQLLVVLLTRPPLYERRPNWGEGERFHTQINLKPLSSRASRALVNEILQKVDEVPSELTDMIVDSAEGNPFYMEELIRMLIEDGVIVVGESQWQIELSRLAEVRVPTTLTGVIQARLDSLPVDEKIVLQRASVVGRVFWDTAVAALAVNQTKCFSIDELATLLRVIRDRDLIFRRERSTFANTEEYIFQHSLLRDVVYETVLLKQRRQYHEQVADWLEFIAGDRLEEHLGLIAGQYELAGKQNKAVEYLQRAGDRARLAYAQQEAVEYYQRALELLKEMGENKQAAHTLMKLGLVHHTAFDYKSSQKAYEEGFNLWKHAEEVTSITSVQAAPHALRTTRGAPYSLDPTMTDHTDSSAVIIQLFSGLVEGSTAREVIPDVAYSWEILEDGRRYLFHLRDEALWSDGTPVTSKDFEFAWRRTLDPAQGSPNANLLYDIKGGKAFHTGETSDPGSLGIQTPDPHTLVVELEGPTGYFLSLLACTAAFPVPRHVVEDHGNAWADIDNLVTNGAFKLDSWKSGESMVLLRNEDFHGQFRGNLDRVELLFGIDKSEILGMYELDHLDILGLVDFPADQWDRARRIHVWEYVSAPEPATHYVGLNVSRPPFDDPRVRRAFALAIDKTTLANETLGGYLFPATGGFIPPSIPGHVFDISFPYDPEQARELLAEAGYPAGRGFPEVEACARERIRPQTEFIQAQWRDNLGIDIAWKILPWRQYLDRLEHAPSHIVQFGWIADYPDPDSFLRTGNTQQRTHWRDEIYDQLVEKARRVMEQDERLDLYARADKILVESAAVIPLVYSWSHTLVKPWVRKFPALPLNEWRWKEIILEPH